MSKRQNTLRMGGTVIRLRGPGWGHLARLTGFLLVRRTLTYLFALAFCLRAAVPLGFMPTAAAGPGQFAFVICTGSGPATVLLDADGQPTTPDSEYYDHGICPYSGAGSLTSLIDASTFLTIPFAYRTSYTPVTRLDLTHARYELPAPARGPPSFQS